MSAEQLNVELETVARGNSVFNTINISNRKQRSKNIQNARR